MTQEELKELVDKYPNNYELGEKVRQIHYKNKSEENSNSGYVMGRFFYF